MEQARRSPEQLGPNDAVGEVQLAACGEYVPARAGTPNLSVEAMMLSRAYAPWGSSVMHNAGAGLVSGVVVG